MDANYLFIDGAYLEECLVRFFQGVFQKPADFDYQKLTYAGKFTKVFYYDALPEKRKNETDWEFDARLKAKLEFFERLRSMNGWHVHQGIVKRHVGEKAQQKEVDVLLAVDMLTHTHRKNMNRLTFIAGDQDFRPLIDAVVRDGMYVTLMYDPRHASTDLINMADARFVMDYSTVWAYATDDFRNKNPKVEIGSSHTTDETAYNACELAEEAHYKGELVARLWKSPVQQARIIQELKPWRPSSYRVLTGVGSTTTEHLKRVHKHYVGDVEWESRVR